MRGIRGIIPCRLTPTDVPVDWGGRPGNPVARVALRAETRHAAPLVRLARIGESARDRRASRRRAEPPVRGGDHAQPAHGGALRGWILAPATAATPFDRHAADFRRDLAPIRSTGGLTFAEALARDSNGGAPDPNPPTQPSRAFKPREPTTTDDEGRPRGAGIGTPRRSPVLACRSLSRSCPPRSRPDRSSTDRRHLPLSIPRSPLTLFVPQT